MTTTDAALGTSHDALHHFVRIELCYTPIMPKRAELSLDTPGPFRADQLRSGDPYELSHGHPVLCLPTGGRGTGPNGLGFSVVGWDPAVTEAGVDAGYSPEPGMLRAPDVAVGNVPDKPGWIPGAPALAIEYADVGQDEDKLQEKIDDLLHAGTRFLWVVRLAGPRRVEVHEPGKKLRIALPGDELTAPGVLKNAVRVEALYDRGEAEQATLCNLLQRQGYEDLDAVLARGREQGREDGAREVLLRLLRVRFGELPDAIVTRVNAAPLERLDRWAECLLGAQALDVVFIDE